MDFKAVLPFLVVLLIGSLVSGEPCFSPQDIPLNEWPGYLGNVTNCSIQNFPVLFSFEVLIAFFFLAVPILIVGIVILVGILKVFGVFQP
jgi:hypothetical protein